MHSLPVCSSALTSIGIIIPDVTQVCLRDWTQTHKQSDENILIAQPEVFSVFLQLLFFWSKHKTALNIRSEQSGQKNSQIDQNPVI